MNLMDKLFYTLIDEDDLPIKTVIHKSSYFTKIAKDLSELIDKLEVAADERTNLIDLIDRLVDEAEEVAEKQGYDKGRIALFKDILYNNEDLKECCIYSK